MFKQIALFVAWLLGCYVCILFYLGGYEAAKSSAEDSFLVWLMLTTIATYTAFRLSIVAYNYMSKLK
jgi:hypothetical protein